MDMSSIFKQRFLNTAVVSWLVISHLVMSYELTAIAFTTATPVKQAPFSKVFFTGSVYAVKDKDYEPSEPSIGFFSLWSKDPTNNYLQVTVQYCLPTNSLTAADAHLTAIVLLNNKQPLITIDRSVAESQAQLRLVEPGYYNSPHGFGDPFDDQFLNPLDERLDNVFGVHLPTVTCIAGSNQFDLTKLTDAIAQLPNRTLQVKLVFSDGATQNWHLGKATVQAIKNLLAIPQTKTKIK